MDGRPSSPGHQGEDSHALAGDVERLGAARRLKPDTGGSAALDRLAGLASRLLGSSSAQVSLLTDVQTVAGGSGAAPRGVEGPLSDSLCTVTAASGEPLVVTDTTSDERVRHLPPVATGAVGSYLGVPLRADDGHVVGAVCVYGPDPRPWSEADVTLLQQVAASAAAELELTALSTEYEASRVLWEMSVEAAGIGTFDWDLVSGALHWDDRLVELFGYDRDTFDESIDAFTARLHPDDRDRVGQALQRAIDTGGEYSAEYRVLLPDGRPRWVAARGRALVDESGTAVRLVGSAYDTTELEEGGARLIRVLEAMSAAFYSLDRDWRFTYVNAEAERLLGRRREELLGGDIWELFPAAVASDFETHYRRAAATGQPTSFEAYYPAPLDGWYELRVWPTPEGLSVYFLDITARRFAQERSERAARRADLLNRVSEALAETMDPEQALAAVPQLLVPALADWCIVTLVEDDTHRSASQGLRDVGCWHVDPAVRPVLEEYVRLRVRAHADDSFVMRALRGKEPVSVPQAASAIAATLHPGRARDLLLQLAPSSALVVPLRARGRTLGLVTLCWATGAPGPQDDDVAVARDVADRVGLALDNARLYAQQRRLAEGLQRSMLTAPAEPDHVQIVVRYVPAAEAAQVGGDWYDAFLQPSGDTVLAIGDVLGHDTLAAATMGQVRSLLRGIAVYSGGGPADILRGVDLAMVTLQMETTATAVVAKLEQTPDERLRGITQVRWSNAGHPPPMAINPDGTVIPLVGLKSDLLLGILPHTERVETEITLDRGATLLMYTDGLVERRDQSLEDGLVRLRATLEAVARDDGSLDDLCDEVLARMLPPRVQDDVALIAVRLHRQDRLRPEEAGPRRIPPVVADAPEVVPEPQAEEPES